jgi:FAD-linked oxidoreductase
MKGEAVINRRTLLKSMGAGLASATFLPACSHSISGVSPKQKPLQPLGIIGEDGRRVLPWRNWSGNQSCQPSRRITPRNAGDVASLVKSASSSVRCVGSGHSFSPLVPTDETLISIARLRGLKSVDLSKMTATFGAGTRLGKTGDALWEHGLGLRNMPDIDTQTIAGAIATSTHGTGMGYGSLSADVRGVKIVNGVGEHIRCSSEDNSDLYHAACNNLGSLGVVTEVTMKVQKRFFIEEKKWFLPIKEAFSQAEKMNQTSRHFEMFAFPHASYMMFQSLDETDKPITIEKADTSANQLRDMKKWTDRLPWLKSFVLNSALKGAVGNDESRVNRSYKIFGNLRSVLFNEMEYSVPADRGLECLEEVLTTIQQQNIDVVFPIEYRFVKADDVWLSPFYKRDSCSISCHNFHDEDFKKYFAIIEPIFLKYDGRPHWGKIHTLNANDFEAKYEMWGKFKEVRSKMDPHGLFFNKHTQALFKPSA